MLINIADNEFVEASSIPMEKLDLEIVNTVGCDNASIEKLTSYLSEGYSIIENVKYGKYAGAYKAARFETGGYPTRDYLEYICRKASGYVTL